MNLRNLQIHNAKKKERKKQLIEDQKKVDEEFRENGYYNRPYAKVIDGVYIVEAPYMQEIPYYIAHPEIKDSVEQAHKVIRKQLKPFVDSILQPFYFSTYEVTNKEYREFVEYVRDSIAVHMVYMEVEAELAVKLLNVSKKEVKSIDISERESNLKKYGWRIPIDNFYNNEAFKPYLTKMYYPAQQRYYRRREFDVEKFRYRQNDSITISVYPDTLGFLKIETDSHQHMTNMYFWHPYFDNFPVVNISYNQMRAFCHWKEQRINKEMNLDSLWICVSPPSIRQYEFALKQSVPDELKHVAHDYPNFHFVTFERSKPSLDYFLRSVDGSKKYPKTEKKKPLVQFDFDFALWTAANATANKQFSYLNGNVSEMVKDEVVTEEATNYNLISDKNTDELHYVLGANYLTDVKVLGDDQFNAIFYKTLAKKSNSDCTTGFRLVYTLVKM